MEKLMEKLIAALIKFIESSYPLSYSDSDESLEINGRPFFMILDKGNKLTLRSYIGNHYRAGKNIIINKGDNYYVFYDYKTVGFIERNLWDSYYLNKDKENFVFALIDGTNEIVRKIAS